MNYIKHLTAVFEKMDILPDCSPFHVSLYIALFRFWNQNRFVNPLSVYRTDLMKAAKIGSVNTYGKCLKQLDSWKLIRYFPSQNIYQLSQFHIFPFDNETSQSVSQNDPANDTPGISDEQAPDIPPRLNNDHSGDKSVSGLFKQEETFKDQTVAPRQNFDKKLKMAAPREFAAPGEAEVKIYFEDKDYPELEALKFFSHYESVGWMVGKSQMQDWKAAARKWMLNDKKTAGNGGQQKLNPGKLDAGKGKDYDEPL